MSQPKTTNPSDQEIVVVHRRELTKPSDPKIQRRLFGSLLCLAILTVLHLPIFLMRQEEKPAVTEESHGQLFAIINEDSADISPAESSLWRYLHFTDPSQWFYPSPTGFSRYNQRTPLPGPTLPGYVQPQNFLPMVQLPPTPLAAEIAPINTQEFLKLPFVISGQAPLDLEEPPPMSPRWRRIGGRPLENPPVFSKEVLEALQDKNVQALLEKKCNPTLLEVNFRPGLALPRILIRDSCGVPKLDVAAQCALRDVFHHRKLNEIPCGKSMSVFFGVDWWM